MALLDKQREPSARELRWFGVLFLAFWIVIAGLAYARTGRTTVSLLLTGAALALTVVYYAVPVLQRILLRAWVVATYPIGWAFSHLVLGAFFYLVLTPVGLMMRALGRDPLRRRFAAKRPSYWTERPPAPGAKHHWHQY